MKKEILVNMEFQSKRVAVIEDGHLEEYYVERPSDKQLVGSIFKGKVSSIVPGIGAAFIDLGLEKNGFLYVTDVVGQGGLGFDTEEAVFVENGEKPATPPPPPPRKDRHEPTPQIQDVLKKEQEVLVQVVKEPFGTKGARLTCQISLAGRFVVFMPHHPHVGISKRIDDKKERERIRQIIKAIALPKESGLIVRTAAWGCEAKVLERDIRFLVHQWKLIQRRCAIRKAPSIVHEEYGLVLRMVRDVLTENFDHIIINDKEEFKRVDRFMRAAVPNLRNKLSLYTGDIPLFTAHGVQREIERIYEPRAGLKSGGYLVIEQTEALVAIDVNTGKFTGTRNLEETAFRTNCEAAREIAKQIRLRDLGGIIIIDFIDMERQDHRRTVLKILEDSLRRDRAKTSFLNLSQLGLVEMTRQRMRKSLESASTQQCPYCQGKGIVKSRETVASEALTKLAQFLKSLRREHVELTAAPEVIEVLARESGRVVRSIEQPGHNRVSLVPDTHLHVEEVKIKRILDKRKKLW
ncbi:MAG: Rne/Rng family ribonuclease [Candidatus Omnitrophica bacterium]|nr:Rne/Rng family ribonuclease [Candidatus Omnitrophota bacterium]